MDNDNLLDFSDAPSDDKKSDLLDFSDAPSDPLKKKVETFSAPSPLKSESGASTSTEKGLPYAIASTSPKTDHYSNNRAKIHDQNKYHISGMVSDALLNNDSKTFQDVYIKELAKRGFNKAELVQKQSDINEGKKLIRENSVTPDSFKMAVQSAEEDKLKGIQDFNAPKREEVNTEKFSSQPKDEVKRNYDLGRGLLLTGNNDEAIKAFSESLNHLDKSAQENPNQQIIQTGNESSIHDTRATEFGAEKNPANTLYNIGLAYLNKKDDVQATNFFLNSIQQDPTNANSLLGLANIEYQKGNKEESKKLASDAARSYRQEALALQYKAERDADKEQQRKSDELKFIAEGLEAFAIGDPEGKLGVFGRLTPQGFAYHFAKDMTLGAVGGLETLGEGVKDIIQGDEMVEGGLKVGAGVARTIFSLIPEVELFNQAVSPIKEAAELNPDNKTLNTISGGIDALFTPVSTIIKAAGGNLEEGSKSALAAELADLVAVIGGGALVHEGVKKGGGFKKSIETLKKLSDEAKRTTDEAKKKEIEDKVNAFVKGINEITVGQLKKEAEKQGKETVVEALDNITSTDKTVTPEQDAKAKALSEQQALKEEHENNGSPEDMHRAVAEQMKPMVEDVANSSAEEATKAHSEASLEAQIEDATERSVDEIASDGYRNQAKERLEKLKKIKDDIENKKRMDREVGKREEPIQAEPNEGGSTQKVSDSGVVQEAPKEVEKKPFAEIHEKFGELDKIRGKEGKTLRDNVEKASIEKAFMSTHPELRAVEKNFGKVTEKLVDSGELKKSDKRCP